MISACGVAIGLALKDSLSNVANGLIIVSTKPFHTGDFVAIGGFEGTVKEIGIIRTELVTGDNKTVVLSNNTVISSGIVNYSSNQTRRVDLVISVSYDTKIDKAKEAIIKGCKKTNNYLVEKGEFCEFAEMNSSSLDFKVRLWCLNPNYWSVYFEALRNIYEALIDANISIPYNTMDVNIVGGNK